MSFNTLNTTQYPSKDHYFYSTFQSKQMSHEKLQWYIVANVICWFLLFHQQKLRIALIKHHGASFEIVSGKCITDQQNRSNCQFIGDTVN